MKQEKKRNEEDVPDDLAIKMKKSLITGKTKSIIPLPSVNKRGSFTLNPGVGTASNHSSRKSSINSG